MAMRSQVYEWTNLAPGGTGSTLFRRSTDTTVAIASGTELSIFIGGVGYNITKPAETTATQFVVIEDVALTPCIGYGSVVLSTDIKPSAVQAAGARGCLTVCLQPCRCRARATRVCPLCTPTTLCCSALVWPFVNSSNSPADRAAPPQAIVF